MENLITADLFPDGDLAPITCALVGVPNVGDFIYDKKSQTEFEVIRVQYRTVGIEMQESWQIENDEKGQSKLVGIQPASPDIPGDFTRLGIKVLRVLKGNEN